MKNWPQPYKRLCQSCDLESDEVVGADEVVVGPRIQEDGEPPPVAGAVDAPDLRRERSVVEVTLGNEPWILKKALLLHHIVPRALSPVFKAKPFAQIGRG
jgi:hypothetical protein